MDQAAFEILKNVNDAKGREMVKAWDNIEDKSFADTIHAAANVLADIIVACPSEETQQALLAGFLSILSMNVGIRKEEEENAHKH